MPAAAVPPGGEAPAMSGTAKAKADAGFGEGAVVEGRGPAC